MGRPREYDDATKAVMRAAAERLVAEGGPDALSLRAVAREAGTSTQAVYSLFGSKDGLVASLAEHGFELLAADLERLPETDDPATDLIEVGAKVFRGFVRAHPSLYRIAFQRIGGLKAGAELTAARGRTLRLLEARVERLWDARPPRRKSVREATVTFNAMCEGLANAELRGGVLPILPASKEDQAWRFALLVTVRGLMDTEDGSNRAGRSATSR